MADARALTLIAAPILVVGAAFAHAPHGAPPALMIAGTVLLYLLGISGLMTLIRHPTLGLYYCGGLILLGQAGVLISDAGIRGLPLSLFLVIPGIGVVWFFYFALSQMVVDHQPAPSGGDPPRVTD